MVFDTTVADHRIPAFDAVAVSDKPALLEHRYLCIYSEWYLNNTGVNLISDQR